MGHTIDFKGCFFTCFVYTKCFFAYSTYIFYHLSFSNGKGYNEDVCQAEEEKGSMHFLETFYDFASIFIYRPHVELVGLLKTKFYGATALSARSLSFRFPLVVFSLTLVKVFVLSRLVCFAESQLIILQKYRRVYFTVVTIDRSQTKGTSKNLR